MELDITKKVLERFRKLTETKEKGNFKKGRRIEYMY